MSFSLRAPSAAWEAVPLPTAPPVVIWGWFKPAAGPNSVVLQLPPQLWQVGPAAGQFTLRLFAAATGLESLVGWTLYGQHVSLDEQTLSWLDAALPAPTAGADQQLILWGPVAVVPPLPAAIPAALPMSAAGTGDLLPGENPAPYLDQMDFYWTNILYLESDIRRARVQLEQSQSKLQSLNRELNFEEMQAADSVDRQNWQDARRWLREAAGSLSRSIKEIDVGLLSGAGQRNRFLDLIENYVKPRLPFPGIKQATVDFEMHHKSARNVLQAAQTALSKGTADGERRANAVLNRLAAKIRQKSSKTRGKNA